MTNTSEKYESTQQGNLQGPHMPVPYVTKSAFFLFCLGQRRPSVIISREYLALEANANGNTADASDHITGFLYKLDNLLLLRDNLFFEENFHLGLDLSQAQGCDYQLAYPNAAENSKSKSVGKPFLRRLTRLRLLVPLSLPTYFASF